MRKNYLKMLFAIAVFAVWYFMFSATHAACTANDAGTICNAWETCEQAGWCMCATQDDPISDGQQCPSEEDSPPGSDIYNDGVLTILSNQWDMCFDADGCECNNQPFIAQWAQCLSDNSPTILEENGTCNDYDGCMCFDFIDYQDYCTLPGSDALPTYAGFTDGNTYTSNVTITFSDDNPGVTATLNGTPITSPTTVSTNWTYTLIVTDSATQSVTATFTLDKSSWGGWGWGGGWWSSADNCLLPWSTLSWANLSGIDYSSSHYDYICYGTSTVITWTTVTWTEITSTNADRNTAYTWAYTYQITTMPTIAKADMGWVLIRAHMAKMMGNFAINVLWLQPDTSKECNFADMAQQTYELRRYARLACQLGLMWLTPEGQTKIYFDPAGKVDRAQFGTILSRSIWWAEYDGGNPYFLLHLYALKTADIMPNVATPYLTETRWDMILMLKKAYEAWYFND